VRLRGRKGMVRMPDARLSGDSNDWRTAVVILLELH